MQAMSTMGLLDSVYWLTWSLWELGLAVVSCLLLMCFGLIFQFDFFLRNGFFALFFLFLLFWDCMVWKHLATPAASPDPGPYPYPSRPLPPPWSQLV